MLHNLSKEHVARLSPAVKDFLGIDDRDMRAEIIALMEKLDSEKPAWLRERQRQMDEALRAKQARQRANEGWPLAAVAAGAIAAGGAGCSKSADTVPDTTQTTAQTATPSGNARRPTGYSRSPYGSLDLEDEPDTAQTDTSSHAEEKPYNIRRVASDALDKINAWRQSQSNSADGNKPASGGALKPNRDATERVKKASPRRR